MQEKQKQVQDAPVRSGSTRNKYESHVLEESKIKQQNRGVWSSKCDHSQGEIKSLMMRV